MSAALMHFTMIGHVCLFQLRMVMAILCYNCSTLDHQFCPNRLTESAMNMKYGLNADLSTMDLIDCEKEVHRARYCIKTNLFFGGVLSTNRFCSSRKLTSGCTSVYVWQQDRLYTSCSYVCSRDACNGAPEKESIPPFSSLILILLIQISFSVYYYEPL